MPIKTHPVETKEKIKLEELYEWTEIPVIRGKTEISPLLNSLKNMVGKGGISTNDVFICGGYARYATTKNDSASSFPNDVDLFFLNHRAFEITSQRLEMDGFTLRAVTNKSHEGLIYDFWYDDQPCHNIQLISPQYTIKRIIDRFKDAEAIDCTEPFLLERTLAAFDLTCCMVGIKALEWNKGAIAAQQYLLADKNQEVMLGQLVQSPIKTGLRIIRYAKRGYRIPPITLLHLFLMWDQMSDEEKQSMVMRAERGELETYVGDGDQIGEQPMPGDMFDLEGAITDIFGKEGGKPGHHDGSKVSDVKVKITDVTDV